MKVTVLTENCAGSGFIAEHGLSYLVEHDGEKILFDAGHTDVFMRNARILGVDIDNDIKTVVLSHGHWDHGDGLQYIEGKMLVAHPGIFKKRFRKIDNSNTNIGLKLSQSEIEKRFDLILKSEPYYISENIVFLGQIPRVNEFEAQSTPFSDEFENDDFVDDDSAIVLIKDNELVIISGCSHSGICNIIDYACQVTGIKAINAVIGGFHLKHNNLKTMYTINFLKEKNIKHIQPSHCTDFPALNAFYDEFDVGQLKTGMILTF